MIRTSIGVVEVERNKEVQQTNEHPTRSIGVINDNISRAHSFTCVTFLAATEQLHELLFPSARPSVTHFSQFSSHRVTMEFLGVITIDKRDVHTKG